MYRFDEVVFELPADSTITTKQIEDDFEKYRYGKTDQAGKDEDMKMMNRIRGGGMTRAEMTVEIQKLQERMKCWNHTFAGNVGACICLILLGIQYTKFYSGRRVKR